MFLCTRRLQWLDTYAFRWDGSLTIWTLFHSYFWKSWRYLPSSIDQLFRRSLLYQVMFNSMEVLWINYLIVFATSCFSDVLHDHLFVPIFWDILSISFWSRVFPMWFSLFLLFIEIWLCLGTSTGLVAKTQIYFQ